MEAEPSEWRTSVHVYAVGDAWQRTARRVETPASLAVVSNAWRSSEVSRVRIASNTFCTVASTADRSGSWARAGRASVVTKVNAARKCSRTVRLRSVGSQRLPQHATALSMAPPPESGEADKRETTLSLWRMSGESPPCRPLARVATARARARVKYNARMPWKLSV